ncbi:unnamed protein product [Chrysoparadoxa australica]
MATPRDEGLWLQYVAFQHRVFNVLRGTGAWWELGADRATLEKQMAILHSAVKANPESVKLRLAQVRLCQLGSGPSEAARVAKKGIKSSKQAPELWEEYLRCTAAIFESFSTDHVRDEAEQALEALEERDRELWESRQAGADDIGIGRDPKMELGMLQIVWNTCLAECASGHEERGLAALMAIAELNSGGDFEMIDMERFWDKEYPRLGESQKGAGLAHWMAEGRPNPSAPGHETGAASHDLLSELGPAEELGSAQAASAGTAAQENADADDDAGGDSGASGKAPSKLLAAAARKQQKRERSKRKKEKERARESKKKEEKRKQKGSKDAESAEAAGTFGGVEGLLWINETEGTAYSIEHGRRIDLAELPRQEYEHILSKLKTGEEASTAAKLAGSSSAEAEEEPLHEVTDDDEYALWSEGEVGCADKASGSEGRAWPRWLPLRAISHPEEAAAEPDRVVLYDEIRPLVLRLDNAKSQEVQTALLLAACGALLPRALPCHSPPSLALAARCQQVEDWPCCLLAPWVSELAGRDQEEKGHLFASSLAVLLALEQPVAVTRALTDSPLRVSFVRNVLTTLMRQAERVPSSSAQAVQLRSWLMFYDVVVAKDRTQQSAVRQRARSLLEDASSSDPRLWSEYARVEEGLGGAEEAARVAGKALASVSMRQQSGGLELCWVLFRLLLRLPLSDAGQAARGEAALPTAFSHEARQQALHALASMAEGKYERPKRKGKKGSRANNVEDQLQLLPPTRALKVKALFTSLLASEAKVLRSTEQGVCSAGDSCSFFYYAIGYSWFQYLTNGVDAAAAAVREVIELAGVTYVPENSMSVWQWPELQWQYINPWSSLGLCLSRYCRSYCEMFLWIGRLERGTSPSHLRCAVLNGLQFFPQDPALLATLVSSESSNGSLQRLWHYVQQIFRRGSMGGMEWMFVLACEVQRCRRGVSCDRGGWGHAEHERLHRLLEVAVTQPEGRTMPLLWEFYVRCEARAGHLSRAKRIYFRAVHACPSSKALWMLAFRRLSLRSAFSQPSLDDLLSTVLEKSIRLRTLPAGALEEGDEGDD